MAKPAALGFRLHTGWAALVVVAGEPGKLEVLLRRRIELLPPGDSFPRFVYHKAAELPPAQAAELIERAEAAARQIAYTAVREVLDHLRTLALVTKAGIPCGSKPIPADLQAILRSHPAIHSAEGALFQRTLASSCGKCGITVISAREREVWLKAADAWHVKEAGLRKAIDALRKPVGAPWGADQKIAAAFALLALR